ncbi:MULTISPECIES: dihydrolipoamide acetyltransferase family protein [unclassified Stenotrophomonas]|uniref:dihydrolipoamide acetyltransferase family protein n=1 Tax=unclassified Stenotrophomonas TaxID=196198 RepID=UPI0024486F62|nr:MULTISPECIES: dihydrolipoamide acetyltransferase family protein [unclassified Stenotrophomonas]MBN5161276.1 2-oxo acid dehydrogenase subunit E2 [Stenotrophomonas maltophilia]MDG9843938.1 2-oxo acid dehydrogenase subunit E2 [Stenotrophomonas sp. GD04054]MDH0017971.1 2-oxo acid dehydrogenase subunit E2 [Stenotrophomonas sp. GD04028]MDH0575064.1 2-oxo acid dehydrogenase subunit E2 [Stenotrophomonas sp. GD03997]MDH0860646.1 2-oxo acid dehydrogenase subunit E2 [Stenotrophomonas sp. GD03882]
MSQTKNFNLPDLGEGLPDATIVEWFVKEGDVIKLDEPLVSMETAKAVVEVPSPFSGKVLKLSGAAGDIIPTGSVLASFELDPNLPQRADGQDTGHSHGHAAPAAAPTPPPLPAAAAPVAAEAAKPAAAERDDAGTVVGAMQSSNAVHAEQALAVGGVKAVPAVRATARKLGVDLSRVRATGADGAVTMADVKQAAADGSAKIGAAPAPAQVSAPVQSEARTPLSAAGKPMRTQPPGVVAKGQPEPLKGVRRNMARVMADAHSKVVPTTLNDDADIHAWLPGNDVTARLVRSIVVAAQKVPAMNAWFDGEALTRTLHAQVDIGIAVDTDDGLFVPALRNADMLDARGIREGVNRLREQVESRSIAASELSGYTISLSNFGMFAGRYATPVVVPPCVAIVGAGRARHQMTPVMGGVEAHKVIPLSVTFEHRAATGGEAARFLRAMMDDLALAS